MTPLDPIAEELIRLSERRALTPVLVTPSYLELRKIFLVELTQALLRQTERAIRIDWCRPVPSAWSILADQIARYRARSLNRALRSAVPGGAERIGLQITASISRPGGTDRQLVIGWCSESFQLPTWTAPVYLTGARNSEADIAPPRDDLAA